ncbi:hypothetical protein L7F22_021390 [Adiantum nelumboides]|nr:hypothetical protein [Adiantum nelumboides]
MYSEWGCLRNDENRATKKPWIMFDSQASAGVGRRGIEVELSDYHRLPSREEELSPQSLLQGESSKPEVIVDLDAFFERLYTYYCGKGLWCIVIRWVIELLSLGFTICFSGFFLLIVDWQVLHTCGIHAVEPCDLLTEVVKEHPLDPLTFSKCIVVTYLILFSLYWGFCFLRFLVQLREVLKVRYFYRNRLQISDRELQTLSWSALLDKIVKFQEHQRLCVLRELSAHDVVMRIMRRDNYLIGMVNKGILAVPLPAWVPGSGPVVFHDTTSSKRRLLLTKTLEWSLDWCVLQHMFDRMDGYKEEGYSSQDRQSIPTVHEVGEGQAKQRKVFHMQLVSCYRCDLVQAIDGEPKVYGVFTVSTTGTASPGTMFGGMQNMVPNSMYANIDMQPRFWGTQGQFEVSQGNLGMAGFSIPPVNMTPRHQHVSGPGSTDGSHRNFLVRKDFIDNPQGLQRRLMTVGLAMLFLSPFLVIFMFVYFFLRHAEEFYHHPSSATSRRWSNLARWMFREFNEMDHLFSQRLNSSYKHAVEYMKQFPSMILSQLAKFVSFVAGGFAATLLIVAFLDESLLEAHLFGRNLLWFAAVFTTITAISRSFVIEEFQVFEPERYLRLVSCFTHYMPKHWRGAENKDAVRAEFESLFQYTGMTLLEELLSIFVTPYALLFLFPKYVEEMLQFIRDFTVHIDGVGDVCSLSVFDFEHHGNQNYGSPFHTDKAMRSCQGKMEKSFVSFQNSYPHWVPDCNGKRFLSILADFQVRSTDELQQASTYPHQFPRPRNYGVQSNFLSLIMQPGYGFKWPPSYSSSAQVQFQSSDLRGDLLFWGNNLPLDQLYWLVDQYYMSRSSQFGMRPAGTDLEVGNEVESSESYHRRNVVYTSMPSNVTHITEMAGGFGAQTSNSEACQNLLHSRKNGPGQFSSLSSIHELPQDTFREASEISERLENVGTRQNTPYLRRPDMIQWVPQQQGQPSTLLTQGSFLEPPAFGVGHFAGSSYGSSHDSDEDQERAWDLMHSRRTHASSLVEEKFSEFELPFGDVYDDTRPS